MAIVQPIKCATNSNILISLHNIAAGFLAWILQVCIKKTKKNISKDNSQKYDFKFKILKYFIVCIQEIGS